MEEAKEEINTDVTRMHRWFSSVMLGEMMRHEEEKIPWTDKRVNYLALTNNAIRHEEKLSIALFRGYPPGEEERLEMIIKQAAHLANTYMMIADLAQREQSIHARCEK